MLKIGVPSGADTRTGANRGRSVDVIDNSGHHRLIRVTNKNSHDTLKLHHQPHLRAQADLDE